MSVRFARKASADLEAIHDYIAVDNPRRADSFLDELVERCHSLADNPRRYPLVEHYERSGLRRCVFGNYLIYYRMPGNDVLVARILNSAMDQNSASFPQA